MSPRALLAAVASSLLLLAGLPPVVHGERGDDAEDEPPVCAPDGASIELTGTVTEARERSYLMLPFRVTPATGRVEAGYEWSAIEPPEEAEPLVQTVFDLGLWDADGYREMAGFRGWSGDRQGRLDRGQSPVHVEAGRAERGYLPGPIEAGIWHVELGVAAVAPGGARYRVVIECLAAQGEPFGEPFVADPVDPEHVARDEAGWYHGDFHLHGYHSHPEAPGWDELARRARETQLDFLMATEYVTGQHWRTLGAVQRAHPDLVIWPGREIITYFGHVTVFGETPGFYEYRHGFEAVTMGEIQSASKEAGALFGIAHPTIFPGERLRHLCRGCEYQLDEETDFSRVDTIEVLTGPIMIDTGDFGLPGPARLIQNPFVATAIDYWEEKLSAGYRITAVSGSDAKGVESGRARELQGYGSSATAVFAEALSRAALREAIEAGRAYIRTRGVAESPSLNMHAVTEDGGRYRLGDSISDDEAKLHVEIRNAEGQTLELVRNGDVVAEQIIDSDPFVLERGIARGEGEGPLGTFWRVQTRDDIALTTIGNPIFLAGAPPE